MFEEFMFKKVQAEVWALVVAGLVAFLCLVGFGALVRSKAQGGELGGVLGDMAFGIASIPSVAKRIAEGETDDHRIFGERFADNPGGFVFHRDVETPGYVILTRYDGDARESIVELYRETETSPVHTWRFDDVDRFVYPVANARVQTPVTKDAASRRVFHAWVEDGGDLLFHFNSTPLYKVDACSRVVWRNDDFGFHHSLERDHRGNYWVPGALIDPSDIRGADESFRADYIVEVSPEGETLFAKSVLELLEENGLGNRMLAYDKYINDPFHLNDVQPVPGDGPFWRDGDVFVSLGHTNLILLYRPQTDELIWWSQDTIRHQHDVDVIDENRIAVFNNNRVTGAGVDYVGGNNKVLVYDFRDGSMTELWGEQFEDWDVRTVAQGLYDFAEDGSMMVEETEEARLLKIAADGELDWEFVNRSRSGDRFMLGWSRYLSDAEGRAAADALSRASCE